MTLKDHWLSLLQDIVSRKTVDTVTVVAVTKEVDLEMTEAAIRLGIMDLGENRVAVARQKIETLRLQYPRIRWHFIGHIQRRQVAEIVTLFDVIQSVDRSEVLEKICSEAKIQKKQLSILLQVNVSQEPQKQGFSINDVEAIVCRFVNHPAIQINGLMMMAPLVAADQTEPYFNKLHVLHQELQRKYAIGSVLSMGMSNDYQVALRNGATMLRLGTILFQKTKEGENNE